MGQITFDCPHIGCLTERSAFTTRTSSQVDNGIWHVFATCNTCRRGVVIEVAGPPMHAKLHELDHVTLLRTHEIVGGYPEPPEITVLDHLPDNVSTRLVEAEHAFVRGHFGTAALGYRTAIERAVKALAPGKKGSLQQLISSLPSVVPPDLIRLLEEVRFLGNDAAHDEEDPVAGDVEAGREFTKLFFTYAFDLPARLREAEERRAARKAV